MTGIEGLAKCCGWSVYLVVYIILTNPTDAASNSFSFNTTKISELKTLLFGMKWAGSNNISLQMFPILNFNKNHKKKQTSVWKCFYFIGCKVPLPTDWATKQDFTFLNTVPDLEMKPGPEMISNSTEDTHKTFISFVFMLHKINVVQPVTGVTDKKSFQNWNI